MASGLGSGLTDTWLYLVAQKTLAHQIIIHGNLGYLVTGNPAAGLIDGHFAASPQYGIQIGFSMDH